MSDEKENKFSERLGKVPNKVPEATPAPTSESSPAAPGLDRLRSRLGGAPPERSPEVTTDQPVSTEMGRTALAGLFGTERGPELGAKTIEQFLVTGRELVASYVTETVDMTKSARENPFGRGAEQTIQSIIEQRMHETGARYEQHQLDALSAALISAMEIGALSNRERVSYPYELLRSTNVLSVAQMEEFTGIVFGIDTLVGGGADDQDVQTRVDILRKPAEDGSETSTVLSLVVEAVAIGLSIQVKEASVTSEAADKFKQKLRALSEPTATAE